MPVLTTEQIKGRKGSARLAMLTVYDYPAARALDRCGLDILFVGDTVGEVELGFDRTSGVTMEIMLHHLGAVRRGIEQTHLLALLRTRSAKPKAPEIRVASSSCSSACSSRR